MKIALHQCRPVTSGTSEGLERLDSAARLVAGAGSALLVTPEMALTGYNIGAKAVRAAAGPLNGPLMKSVAGIARSRGIAVLAGLPILYTDGLVYNAIALIDADGHRRATYFKTHLFGDVDRRQFAAGQALCEPIEFGGWKLGLAICYDVEFPEVVRALSLAGADVILVPTANMLPFTSIATRIVPARAEENAVYIAYANYCGSEGGFDYCGLSCICGPDGGDLARAGTDEEMLTGELSRDLLAAARHRSSHLHDRRPELYGPLARRGELQ